MHGLEERLAENPCKCENTHTPHMQEGVISGLHESLSRQLVQLKEGLEFTRSSLTQELSQQVNILDKELARQITAQTQKDLDILYKATNDHLEQLYGASRDCIAHAGVTIANGLKGISSVGSAMTKTLSNTLKKNMAEASQIERREFERLAIQVCDRSSRSPSTVD